MVSGPSDAAAAATAAPPPQQQRQQQQQQQQQLPRLLPSRILGFAVGMFVTAGLYMGVRFQNSMLESYQTLAQATSNHVQMLTGSSSTSSSLSIVDYINSLIGGTSTTSSSGGAGGGSYYKDHFPEGAGNKIDDTTGTTSTTIPHKSYKPVHRRTVEDALQRQRDFVEPHRKLVLDRTYRTLEEVAAAAEAYKAGVKVAAVDVFAVDVTRNVHSIEDFILQEGTSSATSLSTGIAKKKLQRSLLPEGLNSTEKEQVKEHLKLNFDAKQHYDPKTAKKATPGTADDDMNIVLFYADDWTLKVLGALNPHVMTPNLDEMARNGMVFDYNSVTTSICWISRATLVTGVYAAVHKMVKIASSTMFDQTVKWSDTLFSQLKAHGYYTGLLGKWHAPAPHQFMKDSFDVMEIYYGSHWMQRRGERRHVTDLNGEDSLKFLRNRPKDQKFAMKVAFFATHAWDYTDPPYQPMEESKALYADAHIPMPHTATEAHWKDLPWFFDHRNEGRRRNLNRFDTPENYQRSIKDLYRMATEVDAVVGAVVQELKAQGVYDKTLLIFTTDNGNLHGEHGLAEKWYPWEESVRVPLVIQDPRMPASQRGKINHEFTLSIDLAPTLLRAAKIPVPAHMQGRDIAELYLNPVEATKNWRKDFHYEWTQGDFKDGAGHNHWSHIPAVFALIRRDYKYFYWPQVNFEQLFNVEQDPYEETDLLKVNSTTSAEVLNIMRARYAFLKDWSQSGYPV